MESIPNQGMPESAEQIVNTSAQELSVQNSTPTAQTPNTDAIPVQPEQNLRDLRKDAQRIIYKITNFNLVHPTSIIIDTEKVNIVHSTLRIFYRSFPVLISDIKTVVVSTRLIFGQVIFEIAGFEKNPDNVRLLWNDQAILAKRLILGLIVAYQLMFNPVILGRGKPLLKDIFQKINLKLTNSKTFNNGIILRQYQHTK